MVLDSVNMKRMHAKQSNLRGNRTVYKGAVTMVSESANWQKMSNDLCMVRDSNKAHHHKSDKVMLNESSKSKVERCTKCAQGGHKTKDCPELCPPRG